MLAQDTFIPGSILLSFVAEYLIYPTDQLRNLEDNQNIRGKGNCYSHSKCKIHIIYVFIYVCFFTIDINSEAFIKELILSRNSCLGQKHGQNRIPINDEAEKTLDNVEGSVTGSRNLSRDCVAQTDMNICTNSTPSSQQSG